MSILAADEQELVFLGAGMSGLEQPGCIQEVRKGGNLPTFLSERVYSRRVPSYMMQEK